MKQNQLKKTLFLLSLLFLVIAACRREKTEDTGSPSYQIRESERLVLPGIIALPDNLPNGNTRVATYYAEGVQKYKAQLKAGSNPAAYEWVFVAPEATLYDVTNKRVGTHSAGPAWQLFGAADSIYGQPFAPPKAAASPDPAGIDWLQLMPKTDKLPTGVFAGVSYIQRIATKGGKAPAVPPSNAGETADVKYTAVYRFTKKNA